MSIDREQIKALCKLADEIAVTTEAIGIMGRGYDIALHVLGVMADLGWQITPPSEVVES